MSFVKTEGRSALNSAVVGAVNTIGVETLYYKRPGMNLEQFGYSALSEFVSDNINDYIIDMLPNGVMVLSKAQMQPVVSGLLYAGAQSFRPVVGSQDGFMMNFLAQTGSSALSQSLIEPSLVKILP